MIDTQSQIVTFAVDFGSFNSLKMTNLLRQNKKNSKRGKFQKINLFGFDFYEVEWSDFL